MTADDLAAHLNARCHGGGFDGTWRGEDLPGHKVGLWGGFHAMHHDGYYDGWAHFVVVLDPADPDFARNFRLDWADEAAGAVAEKYELRDYVEEQVAYALREFTP